MHVVSLMPAVTMGALKGGSSSQNAEAQGFASEAKGHEKFPVLGVSETKVSGSETKAAAVLATGNNQSKRTHCFSNRHGRNPRREAEFKPVPDRLQATGITEPWFSKRACRSISVEQSKASPGAAALGTTCISGAPVVPGLFALEILFSPAPQAIY